MKFCLELEEEICEAMSSVTFFSAKITEAQSGYYISYVIYSTYTITNFITDADMQKLLESIFSSRPDLKKLQIAHIINL